MASFKTSASNGKSIIGTFRYADDYALQDVELNPGEFKSLISPEVDVLNIGRTGLWPDSCPTESPQFYELLWDF